MSEVDCIPWRFEMRCNFGGIRANRLLQDEEHVDRFLLSRVGDLSFPPGRPEMHGGIDVERFVSVATRGTGLVGLVGLYHSIFIGRMGFAISVNSFEL